MALCNRYTAWLILKNRCIERSCQSKAVQFFFIYYSENKMVIKVVCVLCALWVFIFWRSTINHGLPFCNSKKYDISLYFSHMMADRVTVDARKFLTLLCWKITILGRDSRLRVVPHFSSGIVERAKRERAWKSPHARKDDTRRRLFSRGVIFKRARVSLALLSLRKNGRLLVV